MTTKWRPEGWKNPNNFLIVGPIPEDTDPTAFTAFEAGADAMLEALFKLAQESPTGTFAIDSRQISIYREN